MRSGWKAETEKLPEMTVKGTEAANAEIGRLKSVIFENDPTGLKEFNDAMNLTGAGDHPAIARAWLRAASRLNEGTHVRGTPNKDAPTKPGESARPSAAQAMYPNLPSATAH